jgi:hypothetical protein
VRVRPTEKSGIVAVATIAGLMIVGALWLAPAASAQPYGGTTGPLTVTRSGDVWNVSGTGFMADSQVTLMLTGDGGTEVTLGALFADSSGALAGSVPVPDGLDPGVYTLSATGVSADGATRVLSAAVTVTEEGETGVPSAPGLPAWGIIGTVALAVLAAGVGLGLFFYRRRSARATGR